ncbi:MAG TPA: YeeE/YedE thiosulfate transporter family protein [Methanolinea sp.]|nr:YeeE/YedE thiosulfate transporter family protein [Methanolinea sp.]HQK56128.1 YeeE/YedE thiosulfate transporter family protein [Methanolinea sp.]
MDSRYTRDTIRNITSILIRHPAFLGATIGILAAFSQALLISAGGPEAYGFCVACHTRDMVNGMTNIIAGTSLALAAISKNSLLPVMSVAGVLIGGYISATLHREHRIKRGTRVEYLGYFLAGVAVLNLAMVFGGCPYRAALRTGYGDLTAILFIVAMAAGVVFGAYLMLKKAEKEDT